ncbi:YolD-like family protein [Bacillus sp. ISL-7]|uniref:YolD-like family protein n=1 Tax=Bacillus sp. ISL-7 TaxID=2819136 RepID=UPI001BEA5DB0|nr:YolD-like family protein [Bacillus sp. ISL-7]MBT2736590.1 YolD-like family protein [Bacillus sp. ISL-7]
MAVRDRGKLKWQPASFLPLAFEMQREMFKDQERQAMPILDEYQVQEFDDRICYAMESNSAVQLTVWDDGFTHEITGRIHYVDQITKQLRVKVKSGDFERIAFEDVVGVVVIS